MVIGYMIGCGWYMWYLKPFILIFLIVNPIVIELMFTNNEVWTGYCWHLIIFSKERSSQRQEHQGDNQPTGRSKFSQPLRLKRGWSKIKEGLVDGQLGFLKTSGQIETKMPKTKLKTFIILHNRAELPCTTRQISSQLGRLCASTIRSVTRTIDVD